MTTDAQQPEEKPSILHVCRREILRPIRDEILRLSGFEVESTCNRPEALQMFHRRPFSLVLVDVEGEDAVETAEELCADVRTIHPGQVVAFVCNWRVAFVSDCPDQVLRTEFDPEAFVAGVREMLEPARADF
jgi:DNA-binding response OmpR family regulator